MSPRVGTYIGLLEDNIGVQTERKMLAITVTEYKYSAYV